MNQILERIIDFKIGFRLFMNRIEEPGGLDKVRENYHLKYL